MGTWVLLPEVQRPEREINHSSPSSAEVKSEWCYTSNSPIWCGEGKLYLPLSEKKL